MRWTDLANFVDTSDLPPWLWPRAAYIHVPFCAHHCGYCDFAVAVGQDHLIERYLDALAAELATLGEPQTVQTLFVGGGTPTHLDAPRLERLLRELLRWLRLAPAGEFSIEANPDSLDQDKVGVLADHGINRVSLGAQSFHPHLLRVLEREHRADHVPRAVEAVKRRVAQVSLDLIFGVPGQSLADWQADLDRALSLQPDHLSTYGLTYEKGTRLWKQKQRRELRPLAEEQELALFANAIDTLEAAGFEHYEISNFALPGRRCRHNQVYWANEAYFGFGMGAARYVHGRRELNTRDLHAYLKRVLAGAPATFQSETLGPQERARETMALQLRRSEGIHRQRFGKQTDIDLDALAGTVVTKFTGLGLLHDDHSSVRLTRKGKYVADTLIHELIASQGEHRESARSPS
jgi:oxygen-independent coproporphyrinogen-3 oxidase